MINNEVTFLNYQPLKVKQTYPSNQGSSDLKLIVKAINKKDYAVKEVTDGNGFIPATELFCYELAKELNIPTPNYQIIEMPNGTFAFGSEWEGGIVKPITQNVIADILLGKRTITDFKVFVSELYALDIFVNNVDRHFGNYIFRDSYSGILSLAFDFSRAWYAINETNPFGYDSFDQKANTNYCKTQLNNYSQFDSIITKNTLDKISNINLNKLKNILDKIPDLWLDKYKREYLISWWNSDIINRVSFLKGKV